MKRHDGHNAVVIGGTGAVGKVLLGLLDGQKLYRHIYAPVRDVPENSTKKVNYLPWAHYSHPWELPAPISDVFYCFGSTRKKAGSDDAFREIELSAIRQLGLVLQQVGAKRLFMVSARGVDPHSVSNYLRVKAEVEKAAKDFPLQALYVYRPSLLLTRRNEWRPSEFVAQKLSAPVGKWWQRYLPNAAPVQALQLARAMLVDAYAEDKGVFIRENRDIMTAAPWDSGE